MSNIIPEETSESLAAIAYELTTLESHLQTVAHLLEKHRQSSSLSPLQEASAYLSLSKTVNALFSLHLRCKGLPQTCYSLNSEVERVSLYEEKVGLYVDRVQAPKYPSANINVEAANRFIEHSISDLSEEQRKGLRAINKETSYERRKHRVRNSKGLLREDIEERQAARVQSISEAAAEFLQGAKEDMLEREARTEQEDEEQAQTVS